MIKYCTSLDSGCDRRSWDSLSFLPDANAGVVIAKKNPLDSLKNVAQERKRFRAFCVGLDILWILRKSHHNQILRILFGLHGNEMEIRSGYRDCSPMDDHSSIGAHVD